MKPKWLTKHELGILGERIAVKFLRKNGYRILARNFRIRYGEIDCIMVDPVDDCTVFVEIKTRTNTVFGTPEEAVTPRKLKEIFRTSEYFMMKNPHVPKMQRIDVIAVTLGSDGTVHEIRQIRNVTG